MDNFDINYRPSRGTLSQTFGYTEKLFDSALALKPTDSKYMFTKWIVKAYKAKLEFWCGRWDNVISLCTDIIAHSGYELTPVSEYAAMNNSAKCQKGEVRVRSHINNSSELDWYFAYTKGIWHQGMRGTKFVNSSGTILKRM